MKSGLIQILENGYKHQMIDFVQEHPEVFDELVRLSISNQSTVAKRAAWVLWDCMKTNDDRIQPYLSDMIASLDLKDGSHQRELLKVLASMKLSEEQESILFDICCSLWEKISARPSVRYSAFLFLLKITDKYPDLIHELELLAQPHYLESLSPGVKRGIKMRLANYTNS